MNRKDIDECFILYSLRNYELSSQLFKQKNLRNILNCKNIMYIILNMTGIPLKSAIYAEWISNIALNMHSVIILCMFAYALEQK